MAWSWCESGWHERAGCDVDQQGCVFRPGLDRKSESNISDHGFDDHTLR
jgi:hypothetical protein